MTLEEELWSPPSQGMVDLGVLWGAMMSGQHSNSAPTNVPEKWVSHYCCVSFQIHGNTEKPVSSIWGETR